MNIKKLAPWNWFKDEQAAEGQSMPIARRETEQGLTPWRDVHEQIDRIFDQAFRGFGVTGFGDVFPARMAENLLLKPSVDVGATDDRYTISVEVPGVEEDDVSLELDGDRLIVLGEKRQESEDKQKDFYRVERSYGSFQRVLSLPADADRDRIDARFRNGVLKISMPRTGKPESKGRVIEIQRS